MFEEIAFGLQNFGVPADEMIKRVNEVMELLDIAEYKRRNPFDLSGGQMQRVALAGILAMKPDVIVLDEPTSQLDPAGSEEVFAAVDKLAKSGITIIMVEQKLEKLAEYCDKILLLHEGHQIAFDTPDKIFSREDLKSCGVNPPAYTRICQTFGIQKSQWLLSCVSEGYIGAKRSVSAGRDIWKSLHRGDRRAGSESQWQRSLPHGTSEL